MIPITLKLDSLYKLIKSFMQHLFFPLFLQWCKTLCLAQEMLELLVSGWWKTIRSSLCSALMSATDRCQRHGTELHVHLLWAIGPRPSVAGHRATLRFYNKNSIRKSLNLFSFTRRMLLMYMSPFNVQKYIAGVFLCTLYIKRPVQMLLWKATC